MRTARALLGDQATLVVDLIVVLDNDADRARETARAPLRFLSGVPGYRASFSRMGFADATPRSRRSATGSSTNW